MTDLELAREWLRGISDDPEDAVALAGIMTRIRMDERKNCVKWIRANCHVNTGSGIYGKASKYSKQQIHAALEQAAGGSAAGSQK